MKLMTLAVAVISTSTNAATLTAQGGDSEVAAAAAALPAILTKIPAGPTALVYERNGEFASSLSTKTGTPIEPIFSRLVCSQDPIQRPDSCSLKNANSLVIIGSVRVTGGTANAFFTIATPTNSLRQPIGYEVFIVSLERAGNAWICKDIRSAAIS